MKIRIRNELLWLNLLVILLIVAIVFFPLTVVRIILGLPFLLLFPGYVLVAALYPNRERMSGGVRLAISLGLSVAIVPLIMLIVNYTLWGLRLESILYSVAFFIFVSSAIAWFRRRKLPEKERAGIEFHLALPSWGISMQDKVISIILVLVILGALGVLGYVIVTPKAEERFTEFYVLGLEGKAIDYPRELALGGKGSVIVGIVNREHETTTYRVETRIDGIQNNEVKGITLEHEEKWEGKVGFVPEAAGEDQKLEFLLYKNREAEPCLEPLRLWLNVTE